jgi:hypothetical protein
MSQLQTNCGEMRLGACDSEMHRAAAAHLSNRKRWVQKDNHLASKDIVRNTVAGT